MKNLSRIFIIILVTLCFGARPSVSEAGRGHGHKDYGHYTGNHSSHGAYGRYRGHAFPNPKHYRWHKGNQYRRYPYQGYYYFPGYLPRMHFRGPYFHGYRYDCYAMPGYYFHFGFGF